MKSQPMVVRPGTRAAARRSALIASAQAPLLRELRLTHATHVLAYRLVNGFAATVSAAEAASLRSDPSVAAVVPDVLIHGGSPGAFAPPSRPSAKPTRRRAGLPVHVIPHACGSNGKAILDPEALQTTQTASANPNAPTARSLGFTGAGVRVAYIADGLDPNNVNFIRPDGRSIFNRSFGGDYQDFSGDGPGQPTLGAEAFLDANSIAGQGIHVYNVRNFSAQPDQAACNIRIEGVAPGASVVGLDVFGSFEFTLVSNFLQAISYAVETDHVNVLNESFGSDPFPDSAALNVMKQFNDAAVAAGTTVTVASGDAGATNTIASPASDPKVISVGASTTFRFYAETNYAATRYFASTGWLNDNVSSLSSGGFTELGTTISLVAPGDFGFASCSTNVSEFQACLNLSGNPSPVEEGGGTSESAPLTAGAAALVIQAYRFSHGGSTPSPALVKRILTSTATDLGLPASEQGAGLLNTYKAVLLAESVKTSAGAPKPTGDTLLFSRGQLSATGWPGIKKSWQIRVTNTGAQAQLVTARGRTFGADRDVQTGSVKLADSTSREFTDASGVPENYATFHFTVHPGMARLTASFAYRAVIGGFPVRLILVDPRGRMAGDSMPQGTGGFGSVDVRAPAPGVWTGVVSSVVGFDGGVSGRVPWRVATQRFTGFGDVQPRAFFLQPGQSRVVRVTETLPVHAGDACGSIVIGSNLGGTDAIVGRVSGSIPVTLRSKIEMADGGAFSGVLAGGNGRAPSVGQVNSFEFHVGRGHRSITANVSLANDPNNNVGAYLVAPDGQALGFGQNAAEGLGNPGKSLSAYTLNPVPGMWTLVIDFMGPVVGNEVADPFSGRITLDSTKATATGLPDSPRRLLKRGRTLTVPVKITNNGKQPEDYFIDARLTKKATIVLDSEDGQTFLLPLQAVQPQWFVPTQASSARVTAKATLPIEFDWGPGQGDADMVAPPAPGNWAAGTFTPADGTVQPGNWVANPGEIGPYRHAAKAGSVTMAMTVRAKAFDPAVTTKVGDLWLDSINITTPFAGLMIGPGKSGVIYVKIRPSGKPGTVVRGFLYVDDAVLAVPPYNQSTGNELVAIPYAYTIK